MACVIERDAPRSSYNFLMNCIASCICVDRCKLFVQEGDVLHVVKAKCQHVSVFIF